MVGYDRFGRPVRGARIGLNNSSYCNYRCIFCHREGVFSDGKELMTPEEIGRVVRILYRFGVRYIKLTGGEPLLRSDILDILDEIKSVGIKEITMTTNGTRLAELAYDLKRYGLDRVNISLHSMRRWRYFLITGVDRLNYVFEAIEAAVDAGLRPVKLNMVILKDINDDELDDLIEYSYRLGGSSTNVIQLIELLNISKDFYKAYHVDLGRIEERMKDMCVEVRYRKLHNRPVYILPNNVWVEIVKPMHNHLFCQGNDRIRITHDGKFKPCLLRSDNHVDFLTAMRDGADDEELAKLYLKAVLLREPFYKEDHIEILERASTDVCVI